MQNTLEQKQKVMSHKAEKRITKLMLAFSLVAIAVGTYAFASPGGDKVKVKIVKIIDGDTTITEKIVDESELSKIDQEVKDVKGKNVKVMMYVEKDGNKRSETKGDQKEQTITMNKSFSFDVDSLMKTMKIEMNIDSLVNSVMNGFDFTIVTDDKDGKNDGEKKVIIKKSGKNVFSFSTDSLDMNFEQFDTDGDGGKNSTIIITSPGDKDGKKVVVKTSVIVIDDTDKSTQKKRSHGKNDQESKDDLKFYPNPSDGKFTIEYDLKDKETALITVLDANGKQLFKDEIKGGGKYSKTVDLGGKGKGVFILNLTQGKKSISKKIIIE